MHGAFYWATIFLRNNDAIRNTLELPAPRNFGAMAHNHADTHEHNHHHGHSHGHHHHDHSVKLTSVNTAFIIGICLNFAFVVVEVVVGIYINSLSLLSDAGHNLADVGALALGLLAFRLVKVKGNDKYTYGYRKTSILVALFNAVVLLVSIGAIVVESLRRIFHPEVLPGLQISMVAGMGIVINFVSAIILRRDKDSDLNIKSAYLHLMADAMVSLGLVIGGIVIYFTKWYVVDVILSIAVAIIILISTWRLLVGSLRLSLDGVPENVNLAKIKEAAMAITGVYNLHHIHVWAISTTENAITAHLVLNQDTTMVQEQQIKKHLKHSLLHLNIQHITLETERENDACANEACDPNTA